MTRVLKITDHMWKVRNSDRVGAHSFILSDCRLKNLLEEQYARPYLCLKVFKRKPENGLDTYTWGDDNLLVDCTKIQNLFAWYGVAPRVYDIVLVRGHFAQVTDFVSGDFGIPYTLAWEDMKRTYGLSVKWDMNPKNWRAGQLVDFQHWRVDDWGKFTVRLQDRLYRYTAWGSRSDPYQSVPELGILGQRSLGHRVAVMRLDSIDFEGKTVLDIGCNSGALCRDALDRGASRVVGVDREEVALTAYELSDYLGAWNVDYIAANLPAERAKIPLWQYDIVYALSCNQVKPLPWAIHRCRDLFFLEGHVGDHVPTYQDILTHHFQSVEMLQSTTDHGPRPLFMCRKKKRAGTQKGET